MPGEEVILRELAGITNAWVPLAMLWHGYFAAIAGAIAFGVRPSRRLAAMLLAVPLASVGVLAWLAGNPFNGTVFALVTAILLSIAIRFPPVPIQLASRSWIAVGALLFAFGWAYPHFLEADSAFTWLYAAPLGLIPCPTLSMLTGLTFILGGFDSLRWILTLGLAGLFYGLFGALHLGVTMDLALAAGALVLLSTGLAGPGRARQRAP